MRSITRTVNAAIALCLLVVGVSLADGTVQRQTAVKLYRGSSVIAASDPKSSVYVANFTPEACEILLGERWKAEALTRTSGTATYKCSIEERSIVSFVPTPICGARPGPDEQQTMICPPGTVGTWLQDKVWTLQPYPTCWVQGDWAPSEPPVGICAPVTPVNLPGPASISAVGISTSAIRVTWDAVAGAAAYSLERCIGATCTTFSQLLCVPQPTGTHTNLPASLTARYRVRASRDAACGAGSDNLGEYSAIVSGTTLSAPAPTPINCAVSAWSAWTGGSWSTCVNSQQSRTETRTRTVTTQPANGGTACPVLSETSTATQPCGPPVVETASLSWTAPTTNTDGTSLTNLAGYRISYGVSAGALVNTVQVADPRVTNYSIENLAPGTYYFAVRAYTSNGTESANSNVTSKIIQ